MGNNFNW